MIRENPKTGVIEESKLFDLVDVPITNDAGRMVRKNPDTGVYEQSNFFDMGWEAIINDAGKSTRIDPETGRVQQSGPFNLWWEQETSNRVVDRQSSAPTTSSDSSNSNDYSSGSSDSGSEHKSSSTSLQVLKPGSKEIANIPTSSFTRGASGSGLKTIVGIAIGVATIAVVGGFIASLFEDKNIIKRLPPVTPPPSNAFAYFCIFAAGLVAVAIFFAGLGSIGELHSFYLVKTIGGGIIGILCIFSWIVLDEHEKDNEREYQRAVKKREAENREIDKRNEAYRKAKAAGKK